MFYKIPLLLTPQPEGGFTVTSPLLPELITEGDSMDEVLANVRDAFEAVLETYQDLGKELPLNLQSVDQNSPALIETIISIR
ncbi:type II toxin-antitoxin system HicB family antitoxin [Dolichospermum sp. UHCC 0684]|jgi:antitoxin HicB|uniref:HicB-like antitoxin of toxin-antitoxin system domain-containing protein n=3 Tax=Aphanizomenonaceae TaxID=1892259 RepID=A0A1Z4V3N2_9CYAN|nr:MULTISPECIES: type II toxin-antitoxin system HicB family antitoxin [Nostocales]MBO1053068.1 type II toxin-antitoxin system HicB family antitoxin [Dolichospermum sp. DET73]MBO1057171.1 type II toxin-antitoxin system HicB family antitoxin [Dolichospermum sp. JUN01]MBO1072038.1 type II toxin-antitoxin system HicB family antitoxin [Dolichospermum sp. DEX189]MBS9394351.1 type II toxin-antitoxin system HicB family antitoxin [Dolichospermum sp. OL01]MCO5797981.1 type II toxin-antitoxin system HicB